MELENIHPQLKKLTIEGLDAIAKSSFGVEGCDGAIAYYDTRKDELITSLGSFQSTVEVLNQSDLLRNLFGEEGKRLAIQFVFNACAHSANGEPSETAFNKVWTNFQEEIDTPTWTYRSVTNIQNINCTQDPIELIDGISIRGRSFEELSELLNWGDVELDYLAKDWMEGAASSFVMLFNKEVTKTSENFLLKDDGTAFSRASRILLSMRLIDSGDVRIGKLFVTKPAIFNVGMGGVQSSGFSAWHAGPKYELTPAKASTIKQVYKDLESLEKQNSKTTRTLFLALRSFSSIYDRRFHEAEDRVVDAITALEALWQIQAELSFRLAFRTSTLLATSDDERIDIFDMLTNYYKIRSKIVHGGSLNELQNELLRKDEPLRAIVRQTLKAFLHLAVNPEQWTLDRLHKEADSVLMHTENRKALQSAMGI